MNFLRQTQMLNDQIKKTMWEGKLEGNEEAFPPRFSLLHSVNINVQQTGGIDFTSQLILTIIN